MSIVLTTDDSLSSAAVVAVHAACASKVETRKGPALRCEVQDKVVLTEGPAIARLLVRSSAHPSLLGTDPETSSQVEELLAVFQTIVAAGEADQGVLLRLNDTLQLRTCLAGNNITIADVMLFHALHAAMVKLIKGGSFDNLCHLVRWFDFVQYLPYVAALPVPIRALGIFDIESVTIAPDQEQKTRPKKEEGEQKDTSSGGKQKGEQTKEKSQQASEQQKGKKNEAGQSGAKASKTKKEGAEETSNSKPAEDSPAAAEKTNKKQPADKKAAAPPKDQKQTEDGEVKAEAKGKGAKEVPTAQVLIGRVDVRVGLIKAVSKHPTVDTMYVTEIDVGTSTIPVVTGVAAYFTPDQLLNKKVCVIVNLGAAPCKGVESAGRILCATSADGKTKEILEAPAAKVGESLAWPGVTNSPDNPVSSKNFSKLAKELTTNAERQAVYRDTFPFTSSAGIITLPTIANGTVA